MGLGRFRICPGCETAETRIKAKLRRRRPFQMKFSSFVRLGSLEISLGGSFSTMAYIPPSTLEIFFIDLVLVQALFSVDFPENQRQNLV